MYTLYAKAKENQPVIRTRLGAIWHLDVDRTYNVRWTGILDKPEYVAIRTVNGSGDFYARSGEKYTLGTNSCIILHKKDISYYGAGKSGWSFYWFEFDLLEGTLKNLNTVFEIGIYRQELADMQRCFTGLGGQNAEEQSIACALFQYLISEWQKKVSTEAKSGFSMDNLPELLMIGRQKQSRIADIAREAGMSERSFRDAVYEATGCSPKEYIRKLEMDTAMEMLRTTDLSVREVSECLFYENQFYFSRVFKEYYGISPKQVHKSFL